ncbi:hypothetical protein [Paraferrimonas haliotis]
MIYREASEVYWDNERKSFKAPAPRKWSYADWFHHIVKVTHSCSIKLVLVNSTQWVNVPSEVKAGICAK